MAVCWVCSKEMDDAAGCVENVDVTFPDGTKLKAIPYEGGDARPENRCHDCNVLPNQNHHPGCDSERCPRCGGQIISCGCLLNELEEL